MVRFGLFDWLLIIGGQYDNQWLQVDFGSPTRIVGVITQGRPTADNWVTRYKVLYGNSTSNFVSIQSQEGSNQDLVRKFDKKLIFGLIVQLCMNKTLNADYICIKSRAHVGIEIEIVEKACGWVN